MLPAMARLARLAAALAVAALAVPASAAAAPRTELYVSLGDSYAAGYQATGFGAGRTTRNGFAYQLPALAAARGHRLRLVNFGCAGATTTSLLQEEGCPRERRGPGGRRYDGQTQLAAAEAFLRANRRRTALVTVSIGGNDVTGCAEAVGTVSCVTQAVQVMGRNTAAAVQRLRRAAGPRVRIVGTTYPDVLLGLYAGGDQAAQSLASLSVTAFRLLINPALDSAYSAAGGRLVDVTAASGTYIPFNRTTTLLPYGTVPVAVARVCELTYYCAFRDIHPRTDGYRLIARLVARTLPRRS
jgi:lysophospholipase L1-like esterase